MGWRFSPLRNMPDYCSDPQSGIPFGSRSIFIVGNARSGTSVFCDCLNLCPDIRLLQEANLFTNHGRDDFPAFFNAQHEAFGNPKGKGTFVPPVRSAENAWAVLGRLASQYRYVGEKVAFGPRTRFAGRPYQDAFIEFQAGHFPESIYLPIIRRPAEAIWSMSKMWPSYDVGCLIECWLRTAIASVELYRIFPRVYYICWERLTGETVEQIGRLLGVKLDVPPGLLDKRRIHSALLGNALPSRLERYRQILQVCREIYESLLGSFSAAELRFARPEGPSWYLDELIARAQKALARLELREEQARKPPTALESGERLMPDQADPIEEGEHRSRYAFAARLVRGKDVLDIGCGTGYGSDLLASNGAASVLGVDASSEAITYAQAHYGRPGLNFRVAVWPDGHLPEKSFDVVVMLEAIEHMVDADACLMEIRRLLRDGGALALSTPNQAEHPSELFNRFHVREYDREELRELLSRHFESVALYGFGPGVACIVASDQAEIGNLQVDGTCFKKQQGLELPFQFALCRTDRTAASPEAGALFPIAFDRCLLSERANAARLTSAMEAAKELVVQAFSRPMVFQVQLSRSENDVHSALHELLEQFLLNGQFEVAGRILELLLASEPDRAGWHYLYAYSLPCREAGVAASSQNLLDALKHYDEALAAGYDEFWVRLNRGGLLRSLGDLNRAEADLERATELHPEHTDARSAWHHVRVARARALIERSQWKAALELIRDDRLGPSAERDYLTGFCLHRCADDRRTALDHYTRALDGGFDEFWVRLNRGSLLLWLGESDRAESDLARAFELNPSNEWARAEHERMLALKRQ